MKRVLVAGASGFLGREVVRVLQSRGHWTRAICRSSARAQGLPASEILIADALHPDGLKGAANGVDVVFSCLGQTVSPDLFIMRPGYLAVDIPANRNLLKLAKDAGVQRFVYVSVLHADRFPQVAYLYAHAQVAAAVKSSGLSYGIIEPTGFFSHFKVLLDLVESNRAVVFGNGNSKTNPIHDEDLAGICADAIETGDSEVVSAGGPSVYTRREMLERAAEVLGKPANIREVPLWIPGVISRLAKWPAPRVADLMGFLQILGAEDFVAPCMGKRTLEDHLRSLTAK